MTSEDHPSRRPDPERVAQWRVTVGKVHEEVTLLVMYKSRYERVRKMYRDNTAFLNCESDFHIQLHHWYCDSQIMRIRRLVDQGTDGGDVYSLLLLLQDMKRACEIFNRESIVELFDAPEAPDYDQEMRDFLVSSMWHNVGDPAPDADRLFSKHIKADLSALEAASKKIKHYADKRIAHYTREGVPLNSEPTLSDISACIDVIEEITKRYIATLTGAGYSSLDPTDLNDWYDIFSFAWNGHLLP